MPDVKHELHPEEALFLATAFPAYVKNNGTNGPVSWLAYDATTTENAFWDLTAFNYGPSAAITLDIVWGAATATSGTVRWAAAVAAITPETDSQDPESKAYDTAVTVDDTHLGTTAKRLHVAQIVISGTDLDSLASDDEVWLKVGRVGGIGGNLVGDAWLRKVRITYSDS